METSMDELNGTTQLIKRVRVEKTALKKTDEVAVLFPNGCL